MTYLMLNGELVDSDKPCIYANDRGLSLGHGLFETIKVIDGQAPLLPYHWQRLKKSSKKLSIDFSLSQQELRLEIHRLLEKNKLQQDSAVIRLTLTQGPSARGILAKTANTTRLLQSSSLSNIAYPNLRAAIVSIVRNEHSMLSQIKSISYLDNVLAAQLAQSSQADEAILFNSVENLAEGAISNLFIIKGAKISTPPITDGALPGVVRHLILEHFKSNFSIAVESISRQTLLQADAVFATNAIWGIRPIESIGAYHFKAANSVLLRLIEQYNQHINNLLLPLNIS